MILVPVVIGILLMALADWYLKSKAKRDKEERATEMSLAIMGAGLVNSKTFCIKDMGSTFACTCPECMREFHTSLLALGEKYGY